MLSLQESDISSGNPDQIKSYIKKLSCEQFALDSMLRIIHSIFGLNFSFFLVSKDGTNCCNGSKMVRRACDNRNSRTRQKSSK